MQGISRHTEEFENVREISLSLSCPEVARILMNITDKVTFVTEEDDEDEVFDDFDYFLYSNLEDIREEILNVIQDRSVDIRSRIERVLQIGASAQRHYDEGDLVMWDECEERISRRSTETMKSICYFRSRLCFCLRIWNCCMMTGRMCSLSRRSFCLDRVRKLLPATGRGLMHGGEITVGVPLI